jgi:hypothetical protein
MKIKLLLLIGSLVFALTAQSGSENKKTVVKSKTVKTKKADQKIKIKTVTTISRTKEGKVKTVKKKMQ